MSTLTTARIVTDGELVTFAKRQHELFTRFNKGVYQDPSEVLDGLQLLIEGKQPEIVPTLAKQIEAGNVDLDADPYVPDGWKVEEHKKGGQFVFDRSKIDLYLSDRQKGSKVIEGNKLHKELETQSVFNANLLDYLLKPENQHLIPKEWKGKAIFFWGTIYRDSGGNLYVRYLYWHDGQWDWDDDWLDCDWYSLGPALRVAS